MTAEPEPPVMRKSLQYLDLIDSEVIINEKWKVIKQLGQGAFGAIFLVVDLVTNEKAAAKFERKKAKQPQLCYESKVYHMLRDIPGVAAMKWYGSTGTEVKYNVLVMSLLGPSLDKLFSYCDKKFSIKTTLMIADQVVVRICALHSRGFVHRDIKPDNFLIGVGSTSSKIHICDFGLSKKFISKTTKQHMPYREDKCMIGTARYCSLNAHAAIELSRRDDLEAIGYMLIYFLRGSLPWQGLKSQNKKQNKDIIQEKKMSTPITELCKGFPEEFLTHIAYSRKLQFAETPDYKMLQDMYKKLFKEMSYSYDGVFDWITMEKRKQSRSS